jgi:hypothetical protein
MTQPRAIRGYLLVTLCYWAFTLSDGALRMLVLLHLHAQGQTAWALALILLPYEAAGVATNLFGGFLGGRLGLRLPLVLGLALQAAACWMLASDPDRLTLAFVAGAQCLSGVAKDLVKTSAKSYVKALAPTGGSAGLFRWVAWMTGSKNAMKGLGFFVGGALLTWSGFSGTNIALASLLALFAGFAAGTLPRIQGRPGVSILSVARQDARIWWLSAARLLLFGSRDAWFAVALPLFLVQAGWTHLAVGAALASWIIIYGAVQAAAPRLTQVQTPPSGARATFAWTTLLLGPLLPAAFFIQRSAHPEVVAAAALTGYGAVFAITSSLHSWLVVAMHDDDRSAERVGFYYSANAVGRMAGTLASGALFSAAASATQGLAWCMHAACCAILLSAACTAALRRALS